MPTCNYNKNSPVYFSVYIIYMWKNIVLGSQVRPYLKTVANLSE